MNILIGCDPEVFVRNPNTNQFRCAHNMVPGTKEQPYPVPKGAVQVDGMALEFNIDPAATAEEFVNNVNTVYHELANMVPGYELVAVPTANFSRETFRDAPPESKILGCEPDYNAYTRDKNPRPNGDVEFRTGSGHVHIGWCEGNDPFDPGHFEDCINVVKQLDFALGMQSLLYDQDSQRRQLYGCAGAFRPKSYGVEYRVLSNAWLQTDDLKRWVFDTTVKAINCLEQGINLPELFGEHYASGCLKYPTEYPVKDLSQFGIERPPIAA